MGTVVRVVVTVLLLGSSAASAAAQTTVLLQGGIIHSTLSGSQASEVEADLGIHGQLSLTLPWTAGPLALRVGTAFTQRGATFRQGGLAAKVQASLDYLQVPVAVTMNTAAEGQISLHAFGGLSPSVMVTCQYEIPGSLALLDPCEDSMRGIYFEWLAGAGLTLRRGGTAIVLDALFNQGLSSIYKSYGGVKTRAIAFIAGVELPLN